MTDDASGAIPTLGDLDVEPADTEGCDDPRILTDLAAEGAVGVVLERLARFGKDELGQRRFAHRVIDALARHPAAVRQEYRDAIVAAGYLRPGDWRTAEAEARKRVDRERRALPEIAPESRYLADPNDGCLYLADNLAGRTLLARFIPRVVANITRDDGAEKTTIVRIQVTLPTGQVGEVDVLGDRLHRAREWAARAVGASAVILPMSRDEAHVLTAAQILGAEEWETVVEYAHTGWRRIDDRWRFLTTSGALGADGLDPTCHVDLGNPRLNGYRLPDPDQADLDALRAAVRASLDLRYLAPLTVMAPLLGAAYRAPLPVLPDTSVFVAGQSGSLKTAISALMCQHYGPDLDAKGLPAEWKSTANALEVTANALAGVLFVIDDYAPQAADDPRRLAAAADRVLRGAANSSDRGRLRPDGTPRPARPPRAQILTSGEDIPPGQSLRARLTVTELTRDDVHRDRLTQAQQLAADGVYALAMAGYIRWLAGQYDTQPGYPTTVRRLIVDLRQKLAADGRHLRVPEAAASLLAGWTTWLRYATSVGAVTNDDAQHLVATVFAAMMHLADQQAAHAHEFSPAQLYVRALSAALTGGHAHLAAQRTGLAPPDALNWGWQPQPHGLGVDERPRGTCIGWISDDGEIYLDPGAAYEVARDHANRAGTPLATTKTTMHKRLDEAKYLASTDDKGKKKNRLVNRKVLGKDRRVVHIRADLFTPTAGDDQ